MTWRFCIVVFALTAAAQTYTRDVAPIVFQFCAPCHRPGEAGPFSLLEYGDVKAHARQIAAVTKSRYMPPWKPATGRGHFEGERRLTDTQIQTLAAWANGGAPEGDPKDLPPPPVFLDGWRHGTPDLIVKAERPYTLVAAGSDVFRNFVLRVPVDRTRYVRALEIRPGTKRVVHHANLVMDRDRTLRRQDGSDGQPGFSGMDVQIESRTFDPDSHFLFWKPDSPIVEEPADMAWRLDPGTDLVLNMHLQPGGKPELIQPSIGLYFTDKPPLKQPMLVQLEHDGALDIPPGNPAFVVTDTLRMPVNVDVLGVYPHAHYLARDMQAYATLPDGTRRWLIHIADWDLNWQAVYRYKQPVFLPKGSVVSMRYTYDNSADNPRNPNHPPARVTAGDRSADEMAHLWLQVLPRTDDGRLALQKASMQRRIEKYPRDFAAHFSLGAALQTENRLAEAIRHYRTALGINPKSAMAHNALGSALLAQENAEAALVAFRAAITADSNYADAHYNLARVLLAREDFAGAIRHLREVIHMEPEDAPALSDLGAALAMTGERDSAFRYLRQAVEYRPEYFIGRYNLGLALAAEGKTAEAAVQFREALRLKPGDPDTVQALKQLTR